MKPDQMPSTNLSKEVKISAIERENEVEEYILGTLLYTPLSSVKEGKYVEIKVYSADDNQPSMKIFRMISRLSPLDGDPVNLKEVSFQDEVNVLKDGKRDVMNRSQVNFSIFVDKETYQYNSIREKPKTVSHVAESVDVFKKLAKQKGATMSAGDLRFESDGHSWVPVSRDGNKSLDSSSANSLMSGLPALEA